MIVRIRLQNGAAHVRIPGKDSHIGGPDMMDLVWPDYMVKKRFRKNETEAFFEATILNGLLHIGDRVERPKDWKD